MNPKGSLNVIFLLWFLGRIIRRAFNYYITGYTHGDACVTNLVVSYKKALFVTGLRNWQWCSIFFPWRVHLRNDFLYYFLLASYVNWLCFFFFIFRIFFFMEAWDKMIFEYWWLEVIVRTCLEVSLVLILDVFYMILFF
jgi:hypothetical protein